MIVYNYVYVNIIILYQELITTYQLFTDFNNPISVIIYSCLGLFLTPIEVIMIILIDSNMQGHFP